METNAQVTWGCRPERQDTGAAVEELPSLLCNPVLVMLGSAGAACGKQRVLRHPVPALVLGGCEQATQTLWDLPSSCG